MDKFGIHISEVNSQDFDTPENLAVSQESSLISQIVDINWRTSGLPGAVYMVFTKV